MTVAHMWYGGKIVEADTSEDQSSKSFKKLYAEANRFVYTFFSMHFSSDLFCFNEAIR